ncbi:unnamed protein product [Adineta steineri]|nr:unnamed protein product [Adineta steineri]
MQKKYDDLQHQTKRQPEVHHHYHAGSVPVPPVYSASAGGYGNTPLLHPSNPGSPAQVARICSALGIRK